jgi:membrane-bound metal-dependent hydrolase YbcI (DUF457 family)
VDAVIGLRHGGRVAAFREHIAFSSLLGIGYGTAASTLLGFTPTEGALAGFLAGVGGMLPDLDLPTGRPGQEVFAITAAIAPLVLIGHVLKWTGLPADAETMMLLMLIMYFIIRYGLAWLVDKLSIHRGMFHSIPAMFIAAEIAYLVYPSRFPTVKVLMGCGVALGFFSHLFLDEVYSVTWNGALPQLKKSFGTAIKFGSPALAPVLFTYALLAALTFVIGEQTGIIGPPVPPATMPYAGQQEVLEPSPGTASAAPVVDEAAIPSEQLTDAPLFR